MKKISTVVLLSYCLCSCSNATPDDRQQVLQQEQYSKTHTAYADSATLSYALDHGITPDSAVVALGNTRK